MVGNPRADFGADRRLCLSIRLGNAVEGVTLFLFGIDRDVGAIARHSLGISKEIHDVRLSGVAAFAHSGTRHRRAVSSQKAAGRPMICARKPIPAGPARIPA